MSKKIFTVLLLAVFMLAQFSIASAVAVAGDASITAIPDFSSGTDVDLDWAATGMASRKTLAQPSLRVASTNASAALSTL